DGSPWVGNIAISFPYLDTAATRTAGIDPATAGGAGSMNYSREQLDAIFDHAARLGVHVSLAPFQYYYWGELLDGAMFAPEHGARWAAFADAVKSGAC